MVSNGLQTVKLNFVSSINCSAVLVNRNTINIRIPYRSANLLGSTASFVGSKAFERWYTILILGEIQSSVDLLTISMCR